MTRFCIKVTITSIFIAICGLFQPIFAQKKITISGVVKNATTGETLIGATLKLSGQNVISGVTNAYGFFSIVLIEGNYQIEASYIGFSTFRDTISVSNNVKLNINLMANNDLDEIVIYSSKAQDHIQKPLMGVDKLSVKDIQNVPVLFGEKDVLKTLQLLPGINAAGEGNSGFYVRGGATDQNLILLDEAPVYNASHLFGFFSTFNSDAIKDIVIYKGGMPAEYGGRLASVVDIRMLDGNKKQLSVEGGLGLISSRLKVEAPLSKDKSSFMISGRRTYADAFVGLSRDSTLKGNKLSFYDLNTKFNYQIDDKNILYLSGYFGRDNLGLNNTFGFNWGNATGTLRWNRIISSRLFSNTALIISKYNYQIENMLSGNEFKVKSSINNINIKQDFSFTLNQSHRLKFGLEAIKHTISPGHITSPNTSSINELLIEKRKGVDVASYVSDEFKINNLININYGLRFSLFGVLGGNTFKEYDDDGTEISAKYYEKGKIIKTYANIEPRIAASFQLSGNTAIKTAYSRNTQHLHLMSNSTATTPTDLYILNSLNTKPEKSDLISLGFFKNINENAYEFSTEIYFKTMKNQIEYRNGTDLRGNRNVEADLIYGKGRAYGIEFYLKKKYGKLSGWLSYTLAKTERQFFGINEGNWFNAKQDRPHDISIVGIYNVSDRWTLSSTFVYSTGNAVTYPIAKYVLDGQTLFYYGDRNGNRTPDFHRLDLSATLAGKLNKKFKSSWNFGIYNLYNRKNPYSIEFKENPDNVLQTQAVKRSLFGIIPSVTWNFKF